MKRTFWIAALVALLLAAVTFQVHRSRAGISRALQRLRQHYGPSGGRSERDSSLESELKREMLRLPEKPDPITDVEQERQAVQRLLDQIAECSRTHSTRQWAQLCDADRMFDEIKDAPALASLDPASQARFRMSFGTIRPQDQFTSAPAWDRYRLNRSVKLEGTGELLAYVEVFTANGNFDMRHWLIKRAGRFAVYDQEQLDAGVRMTDLAESVLPNTMQRSSGKPRSPKDPFESFLDFCYADDFEAAGKILAAQDGVKMIPPMEARRWLYKGLFASRQGRNKEALAAWDKAMTCRSDMVVIHLWRAQIYQAMGQSGKAAESASKFLAITGPNSSGLLALAEAQQRLGRKQDALDNYRKSLDIHPDQIEALRAMAQLLPDDKMQELGKRYLALTKPPAPLEQLADSHPFYFNAAALQALVDAHRYAHKDDPLCDYYRARAYAIAKEYGRAADVLEQMLRLNEPDLRLKICRDYLNDMRLAGRMLDGYSRAPDQVEAFELLASSLWPPQQELLEHLIAAHRGKHPEDPQLVYHQARLHVWRKEYQAAADLLTPAIAKAADPDVRAAFITLRTSALLSAGRWEEGYRLAESKDDVFPLLAGSLYSDKKTNELASLLKLHRPSTADDPEVAMAEINLMFLQGESEKVIEKSEHLRLPAHLEWAQLDRQFRSLLRLGRTDDARKFVEGQGEGADGMFLLILAAKAGDAPKALERAQSLIEDEYSPADFYSDDDLGPMLRSPAMAGFRAKYPPPSTQTEN